MRCGLLSASAHACRLLIRACNRLLCGWYAAGVRLLCGCCTHLRLQAALLLMDQFLDRGFVLHDATGAAVVGAGADDGDGVPPATGLWEGPRDRLAAGPTVSAPAGATVGELQRFLSARGYETHLAIIDVTLFWTISTGNFTPPHKS